MRLPSNPVSIFAVIVGVEGYGHDIKALTGPARDALKMAEQLIKMGVPPAQVQVFHNVAPDAPAAHAQDCSQLAQQLTAQGVHLRGQPNRAPLEAVLASVAGLVTLGAPPGSVLWLYWSGHGIMNVVRQDRFLVTADASLSELAAINIDWVCAQLRTDPKLSRFSQQMVMVDACSSWSPRGSSPRALNPELPGATQQSVEQDRTLASLNGDTARIEKGQSLSLFTKVLLKLLQEVQLPGLDLDQLWAGLKKAIDKSNQPCLLDRIDPRGRSGRATGWRAAGLGERTGELASIVESRSGMPLSQLQRLFRLATGCDGDAPIASSTEALIWDLDEMTPYAGIACRNSEWFALHLDMEARRLLRDRLPDERHQQLLTLRTELAQWLSGCDQAALTQDRSRLEASAAAAQILFVDFGEAALRVWGHQTEWKLLGSLPAPFTMASGLASAWDIAMEARMAPAKCHLELAVPYDMLSKLPLDDSLSTKRLQRIGLEIPFSVRLRDRWVDRELLNNWLQAHEQRFEPVMDLDVELDWLDRRVSDDCDTDGRPNAWLCVHDLSEARWSECLRGHLEQGASWALACISAPTTRGRGDMGRRTRRHTFRESTKVARTLAILSVEARDPSRVVVLADRPDNLPPGAADQLGLPAA